MLCAFLLSETLQKRKILGSVLATEDTHCKYGLQIGLKLKDFGQTMQRISIYCEGTLNVLLPLRSALFFGNDWLSLILQPKTILLKYNLDMPCGWFSCLRVYEQVFLMGPL